jgi:hypothetical protein
MSTTTHGISALTFHSLSNEEDTPQRNNRATVLFSSGTALIALPFFDALSKCRRPIP